ncbi:VanW family protein [Candidatus Peregrinibacteria bacterium]|nr:VanW family protein [Candidatus Peregrinibacteria bacterium]
MNRLKISGIGLLAGVAVLFSSTPVHASGFLLKMNEKNWKVDPETLGWVQEYEKQFWGNKEVVFPSSLSVSLKNISAPAFIEQRTVSGIDQKLAEAYLKKKITPEFERPNQDVVIDQNSEGKVIFRGFGLEGRALNWPETLALLKMALAVSPNEVHLPIERTPPHVEIKSDALRQQGIQELLSTGETNFKNSPDNRVTNIQVGLSRFNGILIPAQTEFIMGNILGKVDETTGYKKELVIKGDKTLPEYGGGLCQVSTTLYRAALWAGLPVTKRKYHSYAVSYYNPQGLDSTIYPPTVDLGFMNDSPNALLIQTMTTEKGEAYVNFYGTEDGRRVTLMGPRYYKYMNIPPPRTEYSEQLALGETKKVGEPHQGFQASWFREVAYGDSRKKPLKEHIYSNYEPRPLYYLIGKEPEKLAKKANGDLP